MDRLKIDTALSPSPDPDPENDSGVRIAATPFHTAEADTIITIPTGGMTIAD